MRRNYRSFVYLALSTFSLAWGAPSYAHFPWLVRGDEGKLQYYFSDGVGDTEYPMPEAIAKSLVNQFGGDGKETPVEMETVDAELFKGKKSSKAVPRNSEFIAYANYGAFRGGQLEYTAMHRGQPLPDSKPSAADAANRKRAIDAEIVDTDSGIDVYPLRDGVPVPKIAVTLYDDVGSTLGKAETDANGKASFENSKLSAGLMAIMFGVTDQEDAPKSDAADSEAKATGKKSHYLTVTFTAPPHQPAAAPPELPALPRGLTSFGAAKTSDAIYVYGGNIGEAHDYSTEVQSDQLLKLDLKNPSEGWKVVSTGPRIQGFGMVAHGDKLIVAGGFTAMNPPGEPQDLRSQSKVQQFDTKTGEWSELPELPEVRSSHDMALIGDKLYVVGGWSLVGKSEDSKFLDTAWSLDLADANAKWEALPATPFKHRALSVVAHKEKIYAIGGMREKGGTTKDVWIYHPTEKAWVQGPAIVGDKSMAGFGNAAWSIGNHLVASTYEGDIEQLDESDDRWKVIGQTDTSRFFHRLIPLTGDQLIAIGGANMGEGKFLELESIPVRPTP